MATGKVKRWFPRLAALTAAALGLCVLAVPLKPADAQIYFGFNGGGFGIGIGVPAPYYYAPYYAPAPYYGYGYGPGVYVGPGYYGW